jgi:hypothetical protein
MWNWADNPWVFGFGGIVAASMLGGLYWLDRYLRLVYRRGTARPQREKPGDARWDPWEEDDPSLPWVLLLQGLFAGFFSIGFRFFLSSYLLWLGFRENRVWKGGVGHPDPKRAKFRLGQPGIRLRRTDLHDSGRVRDRDRRATDVTVEVVDYSNDCCIADEFQDVPDALRRIMDAV